MEFTCTGQSLSKKLQSTRTDFAIIITHIVVIILLVQWLAITCHLSESDVGQAAAASAFAGASYPSLPTATPGFAFLYAFVAFRLKKLASFFALHP